jgi:hypothetical protein
MSKKFIQKAVKAVALPFGGGLISGEEAKEGIAPGSTSKTELPQLPELPAIPGIDQAAIDEARDLEKERLSKRRGRASTITKKPKGILGAETTGTLLGS